MAFPQTPRAVKVDLYLNNGWVDVTNDVLERDAINITRGTADENTAPQPSTCTLTFSNRTGNYSPRNPTGIYYGSIGRNTPIRVAIEQAADTFTRTVSNSWGTADTGQPWTSISSGTFTASDFSVSGGVGRQSVSAAGNFRYNYLAANSYKDVDVLTTFTVPITTITGDSVYPGSIILRWQNLNSYYIVAPEIWTDQHIYMHIYLTDTSTGTQLSTLDTGLIYTPGQAYKVRAQIEGRVIRGKIWPTNVPEPYTWTILATNDSITQAGPIGIRSVVASNNTNTFPIVFSYDDISVRSLRFSGEVSAWPQRWDLSGNDIWAPVEAAGVRRRLGQSGGGSASSSGGAVAPVRSAMRRYWSQSAANMIAYWPMEDGPESRLIAAGLPNMLPMTVFTVATKGQRFNFAGYNNLPSSMPVAVLGNAWLAGTVPVYTPPSPNSTRITWFMHAPASPLPDVTVISQIYFSGTLLAMQITFRNATGAISLEGFDRTGTSTGVLSTGPVGFGLVDTSQLCFLELVQSGSNINWSFSTEFLGDTISANTNGTITGFNFGRVVIVGFDPYLDCKDTAIGHCSVRVPTITAPASISAFNAWSGDPATIGGETIGQRVERLAAENSLTIGGMGSRSNTQLAGPQRVDTLVNLLDAMANSDFGILSEMRGASGLAFRTRASLYNQSAALNLNYSSGQISPPFEPIDDDQQTRNDVIVTRDGGANAEAQITSGRMSTLPPDQGGVGIYSTQVTVSVAYDSQVPGCATWLAAMGTVNETRYPVVTVEIANPNVTALDDAILSVDLGDRLTISSPKTGQTPDQISQIVRGYTERIDLYSHTIGFNCSPESPYQVARLDSGYKLDSTTSILVTGITSSATSMSIATTGTLWSTTGSFPIPIRVAGEVMNVTAISGSSSPQTFTVTRSVNGVSKAQIAGAVVSLAKPSPLPL